MRRYQQLPITQKGCPNLGQHGLTLLEVMITLVLLAVMSIIALEAFRLGHRTWEKGERVAEREQRIRVVSEMLAYELASLHPVTVEREGKRVFAFRGNPNQVFFYTAPNRYSAHPFNGMIRGLSFIVEQGKGLMVQESYPLLDGGATLYPGGENKVVDASITGIRFRYLVPSSGEENHPRWVDIWDPFELTEKTLGSSAQGGRRLQRGRVTTSLIERSLLPLAVEANVTVGSGRGETKHDFLFPVHVGRHLF